MFHGLESLALAGGENAGFQALGAQSHVWQEAFLAHVNDWFNKDVEPVVQKAMLCTEEILIRCAASLSPEDFNSETQN